MGTASGAEARALQMLAQMASAPIRREAFGLRRLIAALDSFWRDELLRVPFHFAENIWDSWNSLI